MSQRYPDRAILGDGRLGYMRLGVTQVPPIFEKIIQRLKQIGAGDLETTWKKRSESGTDPDTGKATYTFTEEVISAVIRPSSIEEIALEPGVKVNETLRMWVLEGIRHFDRIVFRGAEYEIQAPQKEKVGDLFICWKAVLKRLEHP